MSSETPVKSELAPIPLRDGLVLGRSAEADAILPNAAVSRRHALLHRTASGWRVEDLGSRSGTFLNGRLFKAEELIVGDLLRIGPFSLRFDGRFLQETAGTTGARVDVRDLEKSALGVPVLSGISLSVSPCQFVGVIGPSGAGKSTLLDALCALRPADSGTVMIDGVDLYANYDALSRELGYVPQDDIVPLELSIEQALSLSARLRLPQGTPAAETRKLVWHTLRLLGLEERASTPVGKLSGGQRKRVSVGAELLCRPRLMFLDEPTSGLDPAVEFRLMESLRHLAATGCTILCTTHVLDHAFLFDRLAVMFGGRLVFFGEPGRRLEILRGRAADTPLRCPFQSAGIELAAAPRQSLCGVGRARSSPKAQAQLSTAYPAAASMGHLPGRLEKSAACSWSAGLHRVTRHMGEQRPAARSLLCLHRNIMVRVWERGSGDREGNTDVPP